MSLGIELKSVWNTLHPVFLYHKSTIVYDSNHVIILKNTNEKTVSQIFVRYFKMYCNDLSIVLYFFACISYEGTFQTE